MSERPRMHHDCAWTEDRLSVARAERDRYKASRDAALARVAELSGPPYFQVIAIAKERDAALAMVKELEAKVNPTAFGAGYCEGRDTAGARIAELEAELDLTKTRLESSRYSMARIAELEGALRDCKWGHPAVLEGKKP